MFSFSDKSWWASKSFWTSIIAGVAGVMQAAGVIDQVPEVVWTLLASFGLYSLRDAVAKK